MIYYLRHREIDQVKWDQSVTRSVNCRIYAFSWYLDIVSPGWDALIEDDYLTVFPLTHNSKFGIKYLFQPFFTQQLGIFSDTLLSEDLTGRFLNSIPRKFSFIQICLNSMNKVDHEKYSVNKRSNYELALILPYLKLTQNYNQNTSRNLKKGFKEELQIIRKVEPDDLITLFIENFGKQEGKLKYRNYETLRQLMKYSLQNGHGSIIGVCFPENRLCAGIFLLYSRDRIIFHFAASNQRSKETGAMFLLIDSIIRDNAGKNLVFDFEGSSDPDVARFYKGFGACENLYPQVTINRMPGILSKAVNLIKRYRR